MASFNCVSASGSAIFLCVTFVLTALFFDSVVKTECLHGVSSGVVLDLRRVRDPEGNANA